MVKAFFLSTVVAVGMSGVAVAQSACTAVINHISGSILVNQGHGFHHILHGVVLHTGDIAMASGNSSGVVDFSDGTVEQLVHGNSIRIPGGAPCAGAPPVAQASASPVGGLNPGLIGAGAVVLGVGGLVAVAVSGSKSSPVSP